MTKRQLYEELIEIGNGEKPLSYEVKMELVALAKKGLQQVDKRRVLNMKNKYEERERAEKQTERILSLLSVDEWYFVSEICDLYFEKYGREISPKIVPLRLRKPIDNLLVEKDKAKSEANGNYYICYKLVREIGGEDFGSKEATNFNDEDDE